MIKIVFMDMKMGASVIIEVDNPEELKKHWLSVAALGIHPVGCHNCKDEDGGVKLPENFVPPENLPWNPDDFPGDIPQTA